jgi:large subunit ribosomal protein L21
MKAVIKTGGKQYLVSHGEKISVEKLDLKEGESVEFKEVLFFEDKEKEVFLLGNPHVEGVVVKGTVIKEGLGDKKIIFKYKPKKRYKVKRGHRQPFTEVEITEIKKLPAKNTKTKTSTKEE